MVRTPTASNPLDFRSLDLPNQARAQFGQSIESAGGQAADEAIKLQSAVNYGIAADADRQMRQATADFQTSLVNRPDENNWSADWKEKSNEVWENIQDKNPIGPTLRRQLTQNFKDWQSSTGIEVNMLANKQRLNRGVDNIGLDADLAARHGDENGINQVIDGGVHNHLLLPEQAEKMKRQYMDKIDTYAADNYISANPTKAIDWLQEKDDDGNYMNATRINPDQRRVMIRNAEIQKSRAQADNFDSAKLDVDNGNIPTEDTIKQMENSGTVAARQAQGLRTYIRTKGSAPSVENQPKYAASVTAQINAIPQGLDEDARRSYITDIVTSKEYLGLMEPVRKVVDAQMKNDGMQDKPVAAQLFKRAEEDHRNGLFLPAGSLAPMLGDSSYFHQLSSAQSAYATATKAAAGFDEDDQSAQAKAARAHVMASKNFVQSITSNRSAIDQASQTKARTEWEKSVSPEVRDAEQMNYAQYLTKMHAFFRENPKATDEDAAKYSQEIKKPFVMAAVSASLLAPQSLAPSDAIGAQTDITQDQYAKLNSGDTYWWKGVQHTKK